MYIDSIAIDGFKLNCTVFQKEEILSNIKALTGLDEWHELQNNSFYDYALQEASSGIIVRWNELLENSNRKLNGELQVTVPGSYLKKLSLQEQVRILWKLNSGNKATELHIKFQLNDSMVSIARIASFARMATNEKNKRYSVEHYKSCYAVTTCDFEKGKTSASIYFPKNRHNNRSLVIYDPLEKHGINNAQHWELRLKWKYIPEILTELLAVRNNESLLRECIVKSILDSVDFRYQGKRVKWYEEIVNAPIIA